MQRLTLVSGLLFAFATNLFGQTLSTASASSPTVAYVYVGENTSPAKIFALAVQMNGSTRLVSGSPFRGPSQRLVVSSGSVYGTDGTNIVTYTRAANGALRATSAINGTAHNDTPHDSAVGAMTLDRTGKSLYTAEINFQGADNDGYAEFGVASNGSLAFRGNTPISVNYHSFLQFSQSNRFAYGSGCYFVNWDVFGFVRGSDGSLTPFTPGDTFPPDPTGDFLCPSGMAASAKGYVAITYSIASSGSKHNIAIYRIGSSGRLQLISQSITATKFTGIGGVRFDPTGTYLAVAGQNGIETLRLNSNGTLTNLGRPLDTNIIFRDVKWDNVGHVYAISTGGLYLFGTHNGVLSPIGGRHAIAQANSLAVLPTR
jgi:hypothetical protein